MFLECCPGSSRVPVDHLTTVSPCFILIGLIMSSMRHGQSGQSLGQLDRNFGPRTTFLSFAIA